VRETLCDNHVFIALGDTDVMKRQEIPRRGAPSARHGRSATFPGSPRRLAVLPCASGTPWPSWSISRAAPGTRIAPRDLGFPPIRWARPGSCNGWPYRRTSCSMVWNVPGRSSGSAGPSTWLPARRRGGRVWRSWRAGSRIGPGWRERGPPSRTSPAIPTWPWPMRAASRSAPTRRCVPGSSVSPICRPIRPCRVWRSLERFWSD